MKSTKLIALTLCVTLGFAAIAYNDDYDYNEDRSAGEKIGHGTSQVVKRPIRGAAEVGEGAVEGAANILTLGGVSRAKEDRKREREERKEKKERKSKKSKHQHAEEAEEMD